VTVQTLALVGELLNDAAHELNNQLAFVLSNLQNLAEYGEALERVVAAYRERVRAAGLSDPQLAALEAEVDLDFLLQDAGRAAREGLTGAARIRDILRIVGRAGEGESGERPLVDLGRAVTQVLGVETKAIAACAQLVRDVALEGSVAAPPAVLTRALAAIVKDGCARLDPAGRDGNTLRVSIARRGARLVASVERRGVEREGAAHHLDIARAAAAVLGAELVVDGPRTELALPEAR
jgi:hypothetical protein